MSIGKKSIARAANAAAKADTPEEVVVKAEEKVAADIAGKTVVKEIYVPNKLVNIVVK